MANSAGYHEPFEHLSPRTRDLHRAFTSLQEELEAIDWYQQRIDVIEDPELKDILEHNRDEEKEHATMILEWIRRNDPAFARQLQMKLGKPGHIAEEVEKQEASGEIDLEGRGKRE
jgi:ferritin-like protein